MSSMLLNVSMLCEIPIVFWEQLRLSSGYRLTGKLFLNLGRVHQPPTVLLESKDIFVDVSTFIIRYMLSNIVSNIYSGLSEQHSFHTRHLWVHLVIHWFFTWCCFRNISPCFKTVWSITANDCGSLSSGLVALKVLCTALSYVGTRINRTWYQI